MNRNVRISADDDVQRLCRSCLSRDEKLIPLDKPYNHVVNTAYEYAEINEQETIADLMMTCGNVKIEPDDGLPQSVCLKCFMNIRATFLYRQTCERSDAELREILQQNVTAVAVKFERPDRDQDIDPLSGSFDETKPNQLEFLPADDIENNECQRYTDICDIPTDFDTIPTRTSDTNGVVNSKNGPTTNGKTYRIDEKAEAMEKLNLTKKTSNILSERDQSTVEINSMMDQNNTPNGIQRETGTSKREHRCEICAKTFSSRSKLKRHADVHADRRSFQCDICYRFFRAKKYLGDHMKKIHIDKDKQNSYLCSVCGAGYRCASLLVAHTRLHTGERPFCCEHCGMGFRAKVALDRHRAIHAAVKPFKCSTCHKEFSRKDKFKLHMMVHNDIRPYKCNLCQRGFIQPVLLKNHMQTHKGEKAHVCKICGVGFTKSIQLINHRTLADHFETEVSN